MGATCTELPQEILQIILDKLEIDHDIFQCQQVCTKWAGVAQKLYYENVDIAGGDSCIRLARTMMDTSNNIAPLVKYMNVYSTFWNDEQFDEETTLLLTCLIHLLPNLKELKANSPSKQFWNRLLEAAVNQNFTLCKLPSGYDIRVECIDEHNQTALAMKSSLEHVDILYVTESPYYDIFNSKSNLTQFNQNPIAVSLHDFVMLKSLEIEVPTNASIYSFDCYFDKCSKLESVSLKVTPVTQKSSFSDMLKVDDRHKEVDISIIQQLPRIKKFHGHIPFYTDESIKYFMHKFPNLTNFEMNRKFYIEQLVETLSKCRHSLQSQELMTKYFKFILGLKVFDVYDFSIKNSVKFLTKFINDTNFSGRLTTGYEPYHYHDYWIWDKTTTDDVRIRLHNTPNKNLIDQRPMATFVASYDVDENKQHLLSNGAQDLPHIRLIEEVGDTIKHLGLENLRQKQELLSERTKDIEKYQDMASGRHLEHILSLCPNLISLKFDRAIITECPQHKTAMSNSLQELIIKDSNLDMDILTIFSARLPALKYLGLYANEFINLNNKLICKLNMPYTSFKSICYYLDTEMDKEMTKEVVSLVGDSNTLEGFDFPATTLNHELANMVISSNEDIDTDILESPSAGNQLPEENIQESVAEGNDIPLENEEDEFNNGDEGSFIYTQSYDTFGPIVQIFYVKLCTDDTREAEWWYGDAKSVRKSSELEYSLNSESSFLFDIKCKSIGTLNVMLYDDILKRVFFN